MSEGEVQRLAKAIEDLSRKGDVQHEENQKSQRADRETFAKAMSDQRDAFQIALQKQYYEHLDLVKRVELSNGLMTLCVGDGQPGNGRLGKLEETVETLKKFRWQMMAVLMTFLYVLDKLEPLIKH